MWQSEKLNFKSHHSEGNTRMIIDLHRVKREQGGSQWLRERAGEEAERKKEWVIIQEPERQLET